jgi:hypothetical protein
MSALVERINRSMLTIYAEYLGANAAYLLAGGTAAPSRKRATDADNRVRQNRPRSVRISTTEPLDPPPTSGATPTSTPCPYVHIEEQPAPPLTSPQFEAIEITNLGKQALLAHMPQGGLSLGISANADTGASHILIREDDSFPLTGVTRCTRNRPFATLTSANGASLRATGRGKLIVANVAVDAFIFQNDDLASNLLGIIPFSNLGCTAIFKPHWFGVYPPKAIAPIIVGTRASSDTLWLVDLAQFATNSNCEVSDGIPPPYPAKAGVYVEANAMSLHDNANCDKVSYVRFVHACLGYPTPSTFLRAVTAGYITGTNQYPRLTPKMVRKFIPNAMPTAKGHLDRTPSALPHEDSDAVSARLRHHTRATREKWSRFAESLDEGPDSKPATQPFAWHQVQRSTRIHLDYTGALPERGSAGTLYFQISVWGGYINLQPLRSLRTEHTVPALKTAVEFFRHHGAILEILRMDNQRSQPLIAMTKTLGLTMELVPSYVKNPNRAERAIRTAKNHVIASLGLLTTHLGFGQATSYTLLGGPSGDPC